MVHCKKIEKENIERLEFPVFLVKREFDLLHRSILMM